MKKQSLILNQLTAAFIILFLMMCGQPANKKDAQVFKANDPFMEVRGSKTITLAWDPPSDGKDSVASYELWFKTNKNQTYSFLKSISASDTPSVVVNRDSISDTDSIFYFRVQTVSKSGSKSRFHYSTDSDAIPADGWFLLWN